MNQAFSDPGATHPMAAERVNFKNGMIVTADDLSTAMHYPVSLMQALNKAVYGCGVVCGFKLEPDPELCGKEGCCDPCDENSPVTYPNFIVQVGRGTALDCYGLPIELCKPVRVDVSPETCGCDKEDATVCLFIRRASASEAPRGDCCTPTNGAIDCSRQRDHVVIKAFPVGNEPEHACMVERDEPNGHGCDCDEPAPQTQAYEPQAESASAGPANVPDSDLGVRRANGWDQARRKLCRCLMDCDDCECCGKGWVLLGCVEICSGGIVKTSLHGDKPYGRRKWIKTIECFCRKEKPSPSTNHKPRGQVALQQTAAGEDQEFETMQVRDPDIESTIERMVSSKAHRKLFKAQDIRSLDHFIYVLETRMEDMKGLVQFARTPEKLDEYLATARAWKETGSVSEG